MHALLQAPQWAVVVFRLVSHPSSTSELQSPKPELHDGEQVPATQLVDPLGFEHWLPQEPQLAASELVFVSQPSLGSLQSWKPAVQTGVQLPSEQLVEPFALVQPIPQPPQLATLVFRLASQPSVGSPSQSPKPDVQFGLQAPPLHEVDPLEFVHWLLQPLQ